MEKHDYSQITTVAAAFERQGIELGSIETMFAQVPEQYRENQKYGFIKTVVAAAINGPYVADWSNTCEHKWFPWWKVIKRGDGSPGVGLSLFACDFVGPIANVGARHVFETEAKAQHYAQYFKELDEQYYSSNK